MNPNISDLAATVAEETKLETLYRSIGLALDINGCMPQGITYNRFTSRYARFTAEEEPTPPLLVLAGPHARAFIAWAQLSDDEDMVQGAGVWIISRIWAAKREARTVYSPGLLAELQAAKQARDQKVEVYKAVARLAKDAPEDSFAAGLKVNVQQMLTQAGSAQLAALVPAAVGMQGRVEGGAA